MPIRRRVNPQARRPRQSSRTLRAPRGARTSNPQALRRVRRPKSMLGASRTRQGLGRLGAAASRRQPTGLTRQGRARAGTARRATERRNLRGAVRAARRTPQITRRGGRLGGPTRRRANPQRRRRY